MNTSALRPLAMVLTLLLLLSGFAQAQAPQPALPGVAEKLQPFIADEEITGAVTLVTTKDKVLHRQSIGLADREANRPMTDDAIFWIASMTKPVTGVAIVMLQEEGKLSIDDPVAKHLPEFANLKTPSGKPANLTLKHLLTHSSGLGEATRDEQLAAKNLAELVPHFLDKKMQFEPGAKWSYCQSGINTLGRIIEVASGQSYDQFVHDRISAPLGMKDTTFYPTQAQQARIAKTYKRNGTTHKLEPATLAFFGNRKLEETDRVPLANGGLFSTADDYGRFCRMLLNGGTLDGKKILSPQGVKTLSTVISGDLKTGFTPGNGWGCAVCVVRQPQGVTAMLSPGTFGHGGAYGTQAWIDPHKGVAYILMVQRQNFPNSDASDVRKAFQQAAADAIK
jgi:CubicO group peptidase (beta-lactamase class C family)